MEADKPPQQILENSIDRAVWVSRATNAVAIITVLYIVQAIFLMGYNFNQQDALGVVRHAALALLASLISAACFIAARKLKKL